jgi:Porin subfamily
MKMVKSLLLGSAAGLVALAGAQAADLPVKARPVQYVKICSLYGAGFYYIPGTDTCIKVGGFVRAEVDYNAGGSYGVPSPSGGSVSGLYLSNRNAFDQDWRVRSGITMDARSQTEFGTLRSYLMITATDDNSGVNSANASPANLGGASAYTRLWAPAAFIQWAGFTAGKTETFFNFDGNPYTNSSPWWSNSQGGNGVELFAYTAQFGNGLSASLSLENADAHRMGITNAGAAAVTASTTAAPFQPIGPSASGISYGNQEWPDVVGNLRVDQAWGGAQVMGQIHQVRASDIAGVAGTAPSDATGWAIGGGLKFNLPMTGKADYAIGQVTYSKGIMDDVADNSSPLLSVTSGYPYSKVAIGPTWDAVDTGGSLHLATGWSVTGGYEHHWNPEWKTSLWGEYGQISYDAASSAVLAGATIAGGNTSANWSMWAIGSRTMWSPVRNLDLSVEVMYNSMATAFQGATFTSGAQVAPVSNQNWVSGIFRVQRNFYP